MVQVFGRIRVSRYNCSKWLVLSHCVVTFKMRTGVVSRYNLKSEPEIYQGAEALWRAAAGVRVQQVAENYQGSRYIAKTVTSLFTLLSVLGFRNNFKESR